MELKENTSIVVLGASGDLAKKKTVLAQALCRSHLMFSADKPFSI